MALQRLLIKKPVADIQAQASGSHLKRSLGALNLISLGIGAIIGAGIFVMSGEVAAAHAGPAIILSFILAACACGFTGLCYAELASVLPISGSAYSYAYATLGEFIAWIMGWLLMLEYGLSAATVAVGWSGYMMSFLRDFGIHVPPVLSAAYGTEISLPEGGTVTALFNLPAFLIVWVIAGVLVVGIKESANFNNVVVLIKSVVILLFIVVGAFYVDTANWSPFIPERIVNPDGSGLYGMQGVITGAGVIFFAYIGFEAISTAAQEAKNPQKDMPIAIIGSLLVCTLLYILVSGVLTGLVPYRELGVPDPIALGVNKIVEYSNGMGWLSFLIKVGAITGLSSVMLVTMYGQTRIFYIMSRDGLLPGFFSKVHPKFHTPHVNTMVLALALSTAAGLTPIGVLGEMVSMGTLTAFSVVCFSVLYLRRSEPNLHRPFKCPGVPFIPLIGIAFCMYLVANLQRDTLINLSIWMAIGLCVYFLYGRRHSVLARRVAGEVVAD